MHARILKNKTIGGDPVPASIFLGENTVAFRVWKPARQDKKYSGGKRKT
jgi:hypothetical protein